MEELIKKTEDLINNREFEKAKDVLLASYEQYKEEYKVNKNLGLCFVNLNSYEEAKKYFGKQFFNKLWREDNFRIINDSNVAYFDELQKNTSSSC